MGVLGNMVQNSVDAIKGESSGTSLQTFLQKFTSTSGRYVDTLDPLGTFDVQIKFHPTISINELDQNTAKTTLDKLGQSLDRLGNSLVNSLATAGTNFLDNVTGGLYSSIKDGLSANSVTQQRDTFSNMGKHTFIEYLAPAHGLQGGEQWQKSDQSNAPLVLQLGPYIQKVSGINLKLGGEGKTETVLGDFPINGTYVQTDGTLQMEVLNTKAPLMERIFYPWMREITLPWWNYESQPYTTATIIIDFTKHSDTKYVFIGCRPSQIKLMEATQEASSGNITRNVNFLYDYMFVTSELKTNDSWSDKLLDTAGSLAGGAAKMLNI